VTIYSKLTKTSVALAIVSLFAGCAGMPRPLSQPQVARPGETLVTDIEQSTEAQVYLDTGYMHSKAFRISPPDANDALPDKQIDRVSLNESGIYSAIQMLTKDTNLTVSIQGGPEAAARYGAVSMTNVHGSLTSVIEHLSSSMGFFYTVKNKYLTIEAEKQFVIEVPPALNDDNAAGIANTMQALGARDVYLDRINRSLVLRANRVSYERIAEYFKGVRDSRSMIVYEVSIFQVDLNDNHAEGVSWNQLGWNAGGMTQAGSATSGGTTAGTTASEVFKSVAATQAAGFGLGLVLNSSKFSIDSLITFLETQGSVKAISRPRIAIMAGTKGSIRVGKTTTFVSKVGSNLSIGLNQITTETKDVRTGLELSLFGEVSDKTVYSRVALSLSELQLNDYAVLGTSMRLPTTADRDIKTEIRARPGDMILLGGVSIDRNSFDVNSGLMINGNTKNVTRSELVVALKPKLVHFVSQEQMEDNHRKLSVETAKVAIPLQTKAIELGAAKPGTTIATITVDVTPAKAAAASPPSKNDNAAAGKSTRVTTKISVSGNSTKDAQ
jgi:MSHA biogenesis protein MshL